MQIDFKLSPSQNETRAVSDFLSSLSDTDLLIETKAAIKTEREATAAVVRYFKEINDRELYLKYACSSLFQFATERLGYCAGSAQLRINAMRLIEALPETEAKIESGALSLTAAAKVQSFILLEKKQNKIYSTEEKRELVDACLKKSTREVERELAKINPDIQKIETLKPVGRDRFQISFSISEDTEVKVKKLKGLLAHTNPNMTTEELFDKLLELGLEKFDPARKADRALKRTMRSNVTTAEQLHPCESFKSGKTAQSIKADQSLQPNQAPASACSIVEADNGAGYPKKIDRIVRSLHAREMEKPQNLGARDTRARSISAEVKHTVWRRNENRGCEFVSGDGKRCGSQHALQIDHVFGFARGGVHSLENLRVVCAKHNRFVWREKRCRPLTRTGSARAR